MNRPIDQRVAQFTPGPWRYEDSKLMSDAPDEFGRQTCVADLYGTMGGNAAADTRLIAAAPDLFAALEAVDFARMTDMAVDWERATKLSDAALAKARGEQS